MKASRYVVACISKASITKRGYVQKELRQALDLADEQPEGSVFLIPVRLEECEVPARLSRWHYYDLFEGGNLLTRSRPPVKSAFPKNGLAVLSGLSEIRGHISWRVELLAMTIGYFELGWQHAFFTLGLPTALIRIPYPELT